MGQARRRNPSTQGVPAERLHCTQMSGYTVNDFKDEIPNCRSHV